ncbi:MAG: hypothetical protein RLZZ459_2268 [Cyanobacteriota bacterium]
MTRRRSVWLQQIRRRCAAALAACGLAGAGLIFTGPAQAIPEEQAIRKLEVIPVFVLVDERGIPLPIPRDKDLLLPLYLQSSAANQQVSALKKSNPSLKVSVAAVPLNVMNAKIAELNKQLKDKTKPFVAPIVGDASDREQAYKLLKSQGLTDQQINEGLAVPVFFTKPFLTINTPQGPRGVFYFTYKDMETAIATLPAADRGKLKPQVADISAVLREIINVKDDNFVIYPTSEYFRLVQDTQNQAKPTAGTGAAPAPASR